MFDFTVKDLMVTVLPERISACEDNTACGDATEPPCEDNTACGDATEPPCEDNTACGDATEAALRFDVGDRDFRALSAELERLIAK